MDKMIDRGLTPTSKRTLLSLFSELEAGKVIKNGPWDSTRAKVRDSPTGTRCNGIQSKKLDELAPNNLKYCYDKCWTMDRSLQWHTQGCTDDDIDIYGCCPNCRNVYSNMQPQRHPKLFGVPPPCAVSTDVEPAYEDPCQSLLPVTIVFAMSFRSGSR